uniref:Uncharacterized protein n=1 Tax=Rhizophora mucronata TaxID=61149 RepID=A0A2P2QVU0_RHIMU
MQFFTCQSRFSRHTDILFIMLQLRSSLYVLFLANFCFSVLVVS